jgi:hypothetical protein
MNKKLRKHYFYYFYLTIHILNTTTYTTFTLLHTTTSNILQGYRLLINMGMDFKTSYIYRVRILLDTVWTVITSLGPFKAMKVEGQMRAHLERPYVRNRT